MIVTLYMILIGLGIGASFSVLGNAAIDGLSARQRGTATSTLNFIRSLGMTIGITTFGIIQSHIFTNKLMKFFKSRSGGGAKIPEGLNIKDPHSLLSPEARAHIPHEILDPIRKILSSSIVYTFAWAIIPAMLALLAAFFMGSKKLDMKAEAQEYAGGH